MLSESILTWLEVHLGNRESWILLRHATHTLLPCLSSGYHIYLPLWLLLTASLQESWLILCQCVHVCTITCTCMQMCMHMRMCMCEHVQVRDQHQVSSSITFPLIFGRQSLTKPGMISSARLGDQWTPGIWLPLLLQPWDYRQLPIQPSFDVGTGGFKLRSSLLCGRYFTSWTTSPALRLAFIINVTNVGIAGWATSELSTGSLQPLTAW